jgi:outer membrane usher protein
MLAIWKPMSRSTSLKLRLLPALCLGAWTSCHLAHAAAADEGDVFAIQSEVTASNNEAFSQMLLALDINQQHLERTVLVLRNRAGELFMADDDLSAVRVILPPGPPIEFKGTRYRSLSALPAISIKVDEVSQSITLVLKPEAFTTSISGGAQTASPVPLQASPGMFFNYDLYAAHSGGASSLAGGLEAGYFNSLGYVVSNFTLQQRDGGRKLTRLDTTFTMDQPAKAASLRLGDAISRPASGWGSALRFGGIQYASNFRINPGLITMPMQSFSAQAALPSTVDVFVNNVFVGSRDVAPGPFSLNDLPVISGQGTVSMVVRDLAGREQVINQPFYAVPTLLRKGIVDFSFEAGALRRSYGQRDADYGKFMGSGTVRYGLFNAATVEVHAQALAGGDHVIGANLAGVLAPLGVVNASLAASHSASGSGRLWGLNFDRSAARLSFGVRTQLASINFKRPDESALFPSPRRLSSANLSYSLAQAGSLGAFYVHQSTPGKDPVRLLNLNYSVSFRHYGMLGLTALTSLGQDPTRSFGMSWSIPIGRAVGASFSHTVTRNADSVTQLQVQRNLDPSSGYGYRLQTGRNTPHQAALMLENRVGNYTLEAASFQGDTGVRASMSGGAAVLGGSVFATRHIHDSFGVVQLPGMPNVRVYVDNQLAGRTDADGNALLPRLRAYDNNMVRVEQADLGMDVTVGSLDMQAVPYARSGVALRFPITRSYGATLTLQGADGKPLVSGSQVAVEGQSELFPVGMDGGVYITGLVAQNRLTASWPGGSCKVTVPFTKADDPLPNLGTFVCTAIKP